MEDNANKDNRNQQMNEQYRAPEPPQVPPSLLPTVLHRLGLTPEQAQQELSVEEAIVKLKSDDWEERAMAVRLLGRRAEVPGELLEAALDDEDGAVRAVAVHALGNMGKRAPLRRLVQALHDSDWHVRETAVFVLGKQGPRVPDEVLKTVLYDTDHAVREAARYALQQRVSTGETSAVYGQLQEKKSMQQDSDRIQTTDWEGRSSYETIPAMALREQAQAYEPQVQAQAYEPQVQVPYAYGTDMPAGEKITSPSVRRSSKKWWIIIPIVALCFFVLGGMSTSFTSSRPFSQSKTSHAAVQPQAPGDKVQAFFGLTKYSGMLKQSVSKGMNLTQVQILTQLQTGKSMTDIATAQGISTAQLQKIETDAFSNTLQTMVDAGDISQSEADTWLASNLSSPGQLEKWTILIFMPLPSGK